MKLYHHPVSTTSRPVVLFAREAGIALDLQVVDLFTGEQYAAAFSAINASHQVPVLEDGDFRLSESSAILKYLADRAGSPAYPADAKRRARVNERMDWFNTGFYRDFNYGLVYPQVFPHLKREDAAVQAATIAWGREKALGWLKVLDESIIGGNAYVCGDEVTIADHLGSMMALAIEAIGGTLAAYPNITRWMDTMKARPHWADVNAAFYRYVVEPNRSHAFATL